MSKDNIQTSTTQAYELIHQLVYPNGDFEYEAWTEFPGSSGSNAGFYDPVKVTFTEQQEAKIKREKGADEVFHVTQFILPQMIEFETVGDIINNTDYPYCRPNWPIMSRKMLNTLLNVQEFPHQIIPITLIDTQKYYDKNTGTYEANLKQIKDFVALQLLSQVKLDTEKSIIRKPNAYTLKVDKVILDIPEAGLPPIFRIKELPTKICVSPDGRKALENAEVKGLKFIKIYG